MSISYALLYIDDGKKLFLSEPNPNFNNDMRETANRKHLYNLPASEMMSNLIVVHTLAMCRESISKLENALYFGPFQIPIFQNTYHIDNDSCIATLFSKCSKGSKIIFPPRNGVYNSNIEYDLSEFMQEICVTSDVYFGWNNYYLCSFRDMRTYVEGKNLRERPVKHSYEFLAEKDLYLKERINIYEMHKNFNSWLWWMPIGYAARANQESIAKQFIDDYINKKNAEYEKALKEHESYEKDLNELLTDIEQKVKILAESATHISILIKTRNH